MLFRTLVTLLKLNSTGNVVRVFKLLPKTKNNTLYIIEIGKLSTLEILLRFGQTLFRFSVIILTRDTTTYYSTVICMMTASKITIDSVANAGNKFFLTCPILTHTDCIFLMLLKETDFESLPSIWRLKSFCKAVRVFISILREKFA